MIQEIYSRRSIRKFQARRIPREDLEEILLCGSKAPSSKNRQPWKFIVVEGDAKAEMLDIFRMGLQREENTESLLPGSRQHIGGAKYTIGIMEQAPTIIFVMNTLGTDIRRSLNTEERVSEICNMQSVSAAIQNILLAAEEKGIGSLWIGDIFFAWPEISEWLEEEGQLAAAIALGYPAEAPDERPRKKPDDIIVWRTH